MTPSIDSKREHDFKFKENIIRERVKESER